MLSHDQPLVGLLGAERARYAETGFWRHQRNEVCDFFREVGREFVARPFGDATPCPGTIGPLRSRYHDPDPMTMREAMGPRSAAAMTDFDVLWESFFPSHRF